MATMDIIKLYGGNPANSSMWAAAHHREGGRGVQADAAQPETASHTDKHIWRHHECDVIAEGVVAAAREVKLNVPLVVRLEGTNADLGKKILADSALPIILAGNMADAAEKAVRAAESPSASVTAGA